MSIEKNIEKVVDQNVEQITRDFKSFIPDNIVDIAIGYSISFVFALLIFFIGKWISKSVVKILGKALRKVGGVDETLVKFLENIVYYALLTVVIIAALNKLGIATTSFLAILGAAGLAVGLALKDSLGNFASGVMIVLFKPFKAGDSVVAGGVSGTVTEVTIFNTVFLTADNQKIIVPNSSITSGSITNVNANNTRRVDIVVAISYEDSIKNEKDVLGARMMGGGFGGCTINLIKTNSIEEISKKVSEQYNKITGKKLEIYTGIIENGTSIVQF